MAAAVLLFAWCEQFHGTWMSMASWVDVRLPVIFVLENGYLWKRFGKMFEMNWMKSIALPEINCQNYQKKKKWHQWINKKWNTLIYMSDRKWKPSLLVNN
jgi:hypothetical protein